MAQRKQAGLRRVGRFDLLSGWGTAAIALAFLSFTWNMLKNDGPWTGGVDTAKTTLWYFGVLLNLGLVLAGAYFFLSRAVAYWERWTEANGFIDRTWQIITQVRLFKRSRTLLLLQVGFGI